MLRAAEHRRLLIVHCEDEHLKAGTVMTLGPTSRKFGVAGVPSSSEDVIVARDVLIAAQAGKPWHIAHLSTRAAVEIVRWAKAAPVNETTFALTCEATPHHLVFTEAHVAEFGARAKVNPPLRFEEDVSALRQGVRDGTIDAFATDHAPHTEAEKSADLRDACVGFSGLEIAIGAYAYALPDLPVTRFVELLSANPAANFRRLRRDARARLAGGRDDIRGPAVARRPETFRSKGKSTPFAGMTLPRRAVATIVKGRVVYSE